MNLKKTTRRLWSLACFWGLVSAVQASPPAAPSTARLIAEASAFQNNGQTNQALAAYRLAAKAGDMNASFAAGEILLTQARTGSGVDRVLKLSEGLRCLYGAATNRQPEACAALADALQNGLGVPTNLVCAYAWLKIAADRAPRFQPELDRLAVWLNPEGVLQAQALADQYVAGHWPAPLMRAIVLGDPRLQIQGICANARGMLVILNRETIGVGDTVTVHPANQGPKAAGPGNLTISCVAITRDYALVSAAGEPRLKLLAINSN